MKFDVIYLEGTDKIKLGMTSSEIKDIINKPLKKLTKTKWRKFYTEHYEYMLIEYYTNGIAFHLNFLSQ